MNMDLLSNLAVLIIAFAVLAKSASYFVDGAVGLAAHFRIPKLIVGIVLVSMATTAPEFAVSVLAAFRGETELALGNAVGSVICDDGLALGLAGLLATSPILIQPRILRTTGVFLILVDILVFVLALNGVLSRMEGLVFLLLLAGYFLFIVRDMKKRRVVMLEETGKQNRAEGVDGAHEKVPSLLKCVLFFAGGVTGVLLSSHFVVESAVQLATLLDIPKVIIGLVMVAFGTSLPEVVTCVVCARKGQGDIAVGNILGADILNILWIVGMSSVVHPITVAPREIYFMFPAMLVIVITMLVLMWLRKSFGRWDGLIMISLYGIYLILALFIFITP